MSDQLEQALKEHAMADDKRFEKAEERDAAIHRTLDLIKENHLAHIERAQAKTTADIDWIKKILWLFLVPTVGGFIGEVIQLIHK